jgi:long-chain acyl-CoA synthetase
MTSPIRKFAAPVLKDETLLDFGAAVQKQAAANPSKFAIIVGDTHVDWQTFGDAVARTSAWLQKQGVSHGDRVATLGENSIEHVVLFAAILSAGACVVPLPFSSTQQALTRMVSDSGAAMLVTSDAYLDIAQNLDAPILYTLDQIVQGRQTCAPAAPVAIAPDDYYNIIYSSGTTGLPKGIVQDHQFRSRQLQRAVRFQINPDSRMLVSTPLYSNTTLFAVLPTIALGATLVLMEKFNVTDYLQICQDQAITHTMLVPVQYMRLMAAPDFDSYDLSACICKFSTSAPLNAALTKQVMDRWPGNLIEVYGMTEGGISLALNCREYPDKWHTVGKPTEGTDIRIIDEDGQELAPGSFGEIVGRSGSMMQAYHNAPDQTRDILWQDEQGQDFIRSGDMGRFDEDGFLELLDRKKDMIISGGFNIYATDLEAVLRAHPDVADVAVIAIPSPDWGETPLGLVVREQGATTSEDEICKWANRQLGKTQRLSAIELRDGFPRSEIGKILKRELRAPYLE